MKNRVRILLALTVGWASGAALSAQAPTATPTPTPKSGDSKANESRQGHDTSKTIIQNIKAREAALTPTPTAAPRGAAGAAIPGGNVLSNRTAGTPTPDTSGLKSFFESRSNTANREGVTPTPSPRAARKSSTPER